MLHPDEIHLQERTGCFRPCSPVEAGVRRSVLKEPTLAAGHGHGHGHRHLRCDQARVALDARNGEVPERHSACAAVGGASESQQPRALLSSPRYRYSRSSAVTFITPS